MRVSMVSPSRPLSRRLWWSHVGHTEQVSGVTWFVVPWCARTWYADVAWCWCGLCADVGEVLGKYLLNFGQRAVDFEGLRDCNNAFFANVVVGQVQACQGAVDLQCLRDGYAAIWADLVLAEVEARQ